MKTKLNLSLIFLLFAFNCQTLLSFDTSAKNVLLIDFDTTTTDPFAPGTGPLTKK